MGRDRGQHGGHCLDQKGNIYYPHTMQCLSETNKFVCSLKDSCNYVGAKDRCTLHRHEQKGNASDLGGAGWLATNWGRSHTNFAVLQLFLLQYNIYPVTHQYVSDWGGSRLHTGCKPGGVRWREGLVMWLCIKLILVFSITHETAFLRQD